MAAAVTTASTSSRTNIVQMSGGKAGSAYTQWLPWERLQGTGPLPSSSFHSSGEKATNKEVRREMWISWQDPDPEETGIPCKGLWTWRATWGHWGQSSRRATGCSYNFARSLQWPCRKQLRVEGAQKGEKNDQRLTSLTECDSVALHLKEITTISYIWHLRK